MKKLTGFVLCIAISASSFSQPTMTSEDYLLKSKQQNKIGRILLGGGLGCALILSVGATVLAKSLAVGAVTMVVGMIAVPASIPFFIAAGRNKKKGMSLSFKNETAPILQNNSLIHRAVPSFSLKIKL